MKGVVRGNVIVPDSPVGLIDGTEVEIFLLNSADPICGSWQDDRTAEDIVKDIKGSRFSRERNIDL